MKRALRVCLLSIISMIFIVNAGITCSGYDTVHGFVNTPAQVVRGKSFTINLQAQCNSDIGVVMFTLVHSGDIKYKGCIVNDNSCGYIEESYSGNTLSVIYINTKGITATDKTNLIDVTFEADDTLSTADIQICTSNGASADEIVLDSDSGREYSIEITDKITDNKPADDESYDECSDVADNKSSSAINKEIPDNSQATGIKPTYQTATDNNIVAVSKKSSVKLFLAGTAFAMAVVAVIAVSYKSGSAKADKIDNKNK